VRTGSTQRRARRDPSDDSTVRQRSHAALTTAGPNAGLEASIHEPTSVVEFAARLDLSAAPAKPPAIRIRRVERGDEQPLVNDADVALAQPLPGGTSAPVGPGS
jgi:hypothetical protein